MPLKNERGRRRALTEPPSKPSAAHPVPWWRCHLWMVRAAWRAQFQYRANMLLNILSGTFLQGISLAFIWVVVERFGDIGGWNMSEIAFLYGMRLTAHGLWTVPASQLHRLDFELRAGTFDRFLVRPAGPLSQLLSKYLPLGTIGDLVTGLAILFAAASRIDLHFSPLSLAYLVAALLGGAMVECSFQMAIVSMAFRTLSTHSAKLFVDDIMNNFGSYPLKIFPGAARFALTYLLPVAFVAYLPTGVILDRAGDLHVATWLAYAAPLAGPVLLAGAYGIWRTQLRHHSSTGS